MNLYKSDKIRFVSGLVFIIITYSCYHIFFAENNDAVLLQKKVRHIIRFLITLAIYFIGTYHLGKLKDTWMSSLWHLVHISGLLIIISIGLYYWVSGDLEQRAILFANSIQEILISPVLYVAMGLLNRTLKNNI